MHGSYIAEAEDLGLHTSEISCRVFILYSMVTVHIF